MGIITEEDILMHWEGHYLTYLVEILNKEYSVEEAIEDIKSFTVEKNGGNLIRK